MSEGSQWFPVCNARTDDLIARSLQESIRLFIGRSVNEINEATLDAGLYFFLKDKSRPEIAMGLLEYQVADYAGMLLNVVDVHNSRK